MEFFNKSYQKFNCSFNSENIFEYVHKKSEKNLFERKHRKALNHLLNFLFLFFE